MACEAKNGRFAFRQYVFSDVLPAVRNSSPEILDQEKAAVYIELAESGTFSAMIDLDGA